MKFTMMHFFFLKAFQPYLYCFFYTHGSNIESSKLNNLENKILFPHHKCLLWILELQKKALYKGLVLRKNTVISPNFLMRKLCGKEIR